MRPVTIEDTRVVTHEAPDRDEEGRFTTFRAYAEHYSGESGFDGPHRGYIRACSAADECIASLLARLATAETALADRDRHFLWDERLRMEREIGDLATRLATVEAERDRLREALNAAQFEIHMQVMEAGHRLTGDHIRQYFTDEEG